MLRAFFRSFRILIQSFINFFDQIRQYFLHMPFRASGSYCGRPAMYQHISFNSIPASYALFYGDHPCFILRIINQFPAQRRISFYNIYAQIYKGILRSLWYPVIVNIRVGNLYRNSLPVKVYIPGSPGPILLRYILYYISVVSDTIICAGSGVPCRL